MLEGFFWNVPQLRRYIHFDDLHVFKAGPLDDSLEVGEKKKVTRSQLNREVLPARRFSFRPRTAEGSGHCEQAHCRGEATTIYPATTLVSSPAMCEANAAGFICRLADWLSGPVVRTQSERCLSHRRMWSTWLWILTLTVLLSLASAMSESSTESSAAWFRARTQNPRLITSDRLF